MSHVIPAFVCRWLKDSSPGAIRSTQNPNLRIQDGFKAELFCDECEQRFSVWEKIFAERLFSPFHSDTLITDAMPYESWALKFAVSVSWRVLENARKMDDLSHLTENELHDAATAGDQWKAFLQGHLPHPGRFEQYIIPLGLAEPISGPNCSIFLSRYLMRSVDFAVVGSERLAYVYSKLGRLLIIGLIAGGDRSGWKATRLRVRGGSLGGVRQYRIPESLFQFINSRAEYTKEVLGRISPKQNSLIQEAILEKFKSGELMGTEIFKAIRQDFQ
jgi:hypothetical protein